MNELQDMLRVQAILHRKQGANAIGDLFENASKKVERLSEQLESAKNLFAQFYQVLGAHDANENALDAALAASDGNFDFELCPYVAEVDVDGLKEQLAKANERAERCEKIFSEAPDLTFDEVQRMFSDEINKFAIEKKIEALENTLRENSRPIAYPHGHNTDVVYSEDIKFDIEQLRKEQE